MSQRIFCTITGIVLVSIVYVVTNHHSASTEVATWPQPFVTNFSPQILEERSEEEQLSFKEEHDMNSIVSDKPSVTNVSSNITFVHQKAPETPHEISEEPSLKEEQKVVSDKTSKILTKPFTTFLLIMVPIIPKSFHSRQIIRDTWYKGLNNSENVMLRFAMGTAGLDTNTVNSLATENSTHGDLIYFDKLKESRTALTNKTLLLMQWAYSNVNFSYLLKCDDDTFVFVERMIRELKKRPSPTRLYYGLIQQKGKPHKSGTWVDTTWKLSETYMPFALGGGYILSTDLIMLIVGNVDYLEWHPNEDTAVGAWLVPYKVELRKDKLICMSFYSWKTADCQKNIIMHLFYGIKQDKLDDIFRTCAKER